MLCYEVADRLYIVFVTRFKYPKKASEVFCSFRAPLIQSLLTSQRGITLEVVLESNPSHSLLHHTLVSKGCSYFPLT